MHTSYCFLVACITRKQQLELQIPTCPGAYWQNLQKFIKWLSFNKIFFFYSFVLHHWLRICICASLRICYTCFSMTFWWVSLSTIIIWHYFMFNCLTIFFKKVKFLCYLCVLLQGAHHKIMVYFNRLRFLIYFNNSIYLHSCIFIWNGSISQSRLNSTLAELSPLVPLIKRTLNMTFLKILFLDLWFLTSICSVWDKFIRRHKVTSNSMMVTFNCALYCMLLSLDECKPLF